MLFNFVVVEEEGKGRRSSWEVGGAKADDDEVIEHKRRRRYAANCTDEGDGSDKNFRIMVFEYKKEVG